MNKEQLNIIKDALETKICYKKQNIDLEKEMLEKGECNINEDQLNERENELSKLKDVLKEVDKLISNYLTKEKRAEINIVEDYSGASKDEIDSVLNKLRNQPVTIIGDEYTVNNSLYNKEPCKHCSNNPSNGGSGICNCTLGINKIE